MIPTPAEDERLNLTRRRFFFFGSLFLAKPEIVVPEPAIRVAERISICWGTPDERYLRSTYCVETQNGECYSYDSMCRIEKLLRMPFVVYPGSGKIVSTQTFVVTPTRGRQ